MPKPTVCVTMIVRNEENVIARCLEAVRPHIDAYAIVDTGSEDDTIGVARRAMDGVPGEIATREWKGMAGSRNDALELAREQGCDYILMLDADDLWVADDGFQWPELTAEAYDVTLVSGTSRWDRPVLMRSDVDWRYEGSAHEYTVGGKVGGRLRGAHIRSLPDGHRRVTEGQSKYDRIAKILEDELEKDPSNPRNTFYLAQSYRDGGHPERAIPVYLRRASMGGFAEEQWFAQFEAGRLMRNAGYDFDTVEAALLKAHRLRPLRAEPLVELAILCRRAKHPEQAMLYAATVGMLPYPHKDRLFIEEGAYTWRGPDEWAMAMHQLGNDEAAVQAWKFLLATKGKSVPEGDAERIRRNIERLSKGSRQTSEQQSLLVSDDLVPERLAERALHLGPVIRWSRSRLRGLRERYIRGTSSDDMAASLEVVSLGVALARVCTLESVLDLGAGFSSAAFRSGKIDRVVTVEEKDEWKDKAIEFLRREQLSTEQVLSLPEFLDLDGEFDLVFCDFSFGNRVETLPRVWELVRPGGFVLFDDMHAPAFVGPLRAFLKEREYVGYDVEALTKDRFGRFGWLVQKP